MTRSQIILVVLVALSVVVGGYQAALYYYRHASASENFVCIWIVCFCVLLAMWLAADGREQQSSLQPFSQNRLVTFIFVLPYSAYYLVKTRGAVGVMWFISLLALFYLGYLLQLLIYAAG